MPNTKLFNKDEIKEMRAFMAENLKPLMEDYLLDSTDVNESYHEECPLCEKEVEYSMSFDTFRPIRCPNCKKFFTPCAVCKYYFDECPDACPVRFILEKRKEKGE